MTNQYIFFWKSKKIKKRQTFEFSKCSIECSISQITFFRKVRDNNIDFENFLKFDSPQIELIYLLGNTFLFKNSKVWGFIIKKWRFKSEK